MSNRSSPCAKSFSEILKSHTAAKSFGEVCKFNPYHDEEGLFSSSSGAASLSYEPGKSTEHSASAADDVPAQKGFKGTLYHGSPATDIKQFDIKRAGKNTQSGEKLIFFTDSKQMADDFSYERLEGSSTFFQRRGKKGRVYEVDVEIKNPLDLRKPSDKDIENIIKLDDDGILTKDSIKKLSKKNNQLLKASLDLRAERLKEMGYDGLIANTGKAGHNSVEYAVVDGKQANIVKSANIPIEILKFNPYHDKEGRFTTRDGYVTFSPGQGVQGKRSVVLENDKRRDDGDGPIRGAHSNVGRAPFAEARAKVKPLSSYGSHDEAISDIEGKIKRQMYESAALVDKNGKVVLFKDGGNSQVAFSREECASMRGKTLTHNHPSSSMFSSEDMACFISNNLLEIRAVGNNGTVYSMKRVARKDLSRYDVEATYKEHMFIDAYNEQRRKAIRKAQDELDGQGMWFKIQKGEVTHEQANQQFREIMNKELERYASRHAKTYGLEFAKVVP